MQLSGNVMHEKDMKKIVVLLSVVLLAGCATAPARPAGISQFVETRDGRLSVWGFDIQLERLSFQPEIASDHIAIQDGKRGRDLRSIMEWSVSEDRKCLRIRFKPGMGDFGTGNGVTVHLDRSAILGYSGVNNRFEWQVLTDIQ